MTDVVLGIRLTADSKGLVGEVRLSRQELDRLGQGAQQASRGAAQLNRESQSLSRTMVLAGRAAGAFVALLGAREISQAATAIVRIASDYEQLRLRLETVAGSGELANIQFDRIKEFARTTPFEVNNLVAAFTRLSAAGIQPTDAVLESFGNTAAAFGRDITDFADAVIGAVTGETERLKAFGIVARIEGDKMSLNFRGRTREVTRDAQSIVEALTEIGATEFAGGMERQSQSAAGALSNLKDATSELFDELGRAGLLDALTSSLRGLTSGVESVRRAGFPTIAEELEEAEAGVRLIENRLAIAQQGGNRALQFGLLFANPDDLRSDLSGAQAQRSDVLRRLDLQRRNQDSVVVAEQARQAAAQQATADAAAAKALSERLEKGQELNAALELEIRQLERLVEAQTRGAAAVQQANSQSEIEAALAKVKIDAEGELGRAIADNLRTRERLAAVTEAAAEGEEARLALQEEGTILADRLRTTQEQVNAELERYSLLLAAGAIDQETYNRAVAEAEGRLRDVRSQADVLAGSLDSLVDEALAGNIESWEELGLVAVRVINQMIGELIRLKAAEQGIGSGGSGSGGIIAALIGLFGSTASSAGAGPQFTGTGTEGLASSGSFAAGGLVRGPGGPRSDSIAARLSNGEFVVNAAATRRHLPVLEQINAGPRRFADGGLVSGGGTQVNVSIEQGAGVEVSVERQRQDAAGNVDLLLKAVRRDLMRDARDGGEVSRSFAASLGTGFARQGA